ncbi:hypothetical protein FKW77_000443 [Venturia effusa]|uniref:Copper homeostasis protein cutC homolog n=1 Tax=Venturia effusa TaxID=50376 RepID=A0A517LHX9_9PEZI|nr:hypothetical protein FKW77_000443 [Venturia effusa]
MPLEIACFNVESAITAAKAGADRIELCANGRLGGTTPSTADFATLRNLLRTLPGTAALVPIHVMIRPRGGNFVYSPGEIANMESSIEEFMGLDDGGPDGFVFGLLNEDGEVDGEGCIRLLDRKGGRACTFHRAFDSIPAGKRGEAVEEILGLGFQGILTSGGANDAVGGKEVLAQLVRKVRGRGCMIIVGGGVRSRNLESLKEGIGAKWWHSSADVRGVGDANEEEVMRLVEMVESG